MHIPVYISPMNLELYDGTEVVVRSVNSLDKPLFIQGLSELSSKSKYFRFNTASFSFNTVNLKYLTEMNHIDHVAIGAGLRMGEEAVIKGVGIGRYVRIKGRPEEAELALTVADAYQRQGVGTILLAGLSRCAEQQGVRYFVAHVHASRRGLIQALIDLDAQVVECNSNVMELILPVPSADRLQVHPQSKSHQFYERVYHMLEPEALA